MTSRNDHPAVVGITGASGAIMARSVIDRLLELEITVMATASAAARMVWREEVTESFGDALERWGDSGRFTYFAHGDLVSRAVYSLRHL